MTVKLIEHTALENTAMAIRKCWASEGKSDSEHELIPLIHSETGDEMSYSITHCGPDDKALIDRIGNKYKHASTLEHLVYKFDIDGISRACLQELARHRLASLSVKSTRYTLKELKEERIFDASNPDEYRERAAKYLVMTGVDNVDYSSIKALENTRLMLTQGIKNDIAKYCLPESYKTSLMWTINARSLQNFLALRTNKSALWEIRDLASSIFKALPEEHKYLFEDSIYNPEAPETVTITKKELEELKEFKFMYESCAD